jgi:hypothetical protein
MAIKNHLVLNYSEQEISKNEVISIIKTGPNTIFNDVHSKYK